MGEKTFSNRLFEALSDMENPIKDSTADVGKYSYDYVTLSGVFDVVKPVLAKHGLMVRQSIEKHVEGWTLNTYVFDATEERLLDERPIYSTPIAKITAYARHTQGATRSTAAWDWLQLTLMRSRLATRFKRQMP